MGYLEKVILVSTEARRTIQFPERASTFKLFSYL